jgi:hypothetical protein
MFPPAAELLEQSLFVEGKPRALGFVAAKAVSNSSTDVPSRSSSPKSSRMRASLRGSCITRIDLARISDQIASTQEGQRDSDGADGRSEASAHLFDIAPFPGGAVSMQI